MERQTGRRPKDLDGPDCPAWGAHVWLWWCDLHRGRGIGGMGPAPISWSDLAAWSALTGAEPTPVEVSLIMDIDGAWMEAVAADAKTAAARR